MSGKGRKNNSKGRQGKNGDLNTNDNSVSVANRRQSCSRSRSVDKIESSQSSNCQKRKRPKETVTEVEDNRSPVKRNKKTRCNVTVERGENSKDTRKSTFKPDRRLNESVETELDYEDDVMEDGSVPPEHITVTVTTGVGDNDDLERNSEEEDDGEIFSDEDEVVLMPTEGSDTDEVILNQRQSQPLSRKELEEKEEEEIRKWSNDNPAFEHFIKKMVAKEVKEVQSSEADKRKQKGKETERSSIGESCANNNKIKSPSDTTIYAALLNRITQDKISPRRLILPNVSVDRTPDHVTQVFEGLCPSLSSDKKSKNRDVQATPKSREGHVDTISEKTMRKIKEAEQLRAEIDTPKGIIDNPYFNEEIREDDEFFHITCHVDTQSTTKIQRGEFVDLEKLVPRMKGKNKTDELHKTELCFQDGHPYFVPYTDRERKISNFCKWENAFRVYAAIYSQANPTRSAEIWQYVYLINTASSSYQWHNVTEYDFAFRQMIAANPKRSWGKIYAQMWQVCMTDPINKNNQYNNNFSSRNQFQGGNSSQSSGSASVNSLTQLLHKLSSRNGGNSQTKSKLDYC